MVQYTCPPGPAAVRTRRGAPPGNRLVLTKANTSIISVDGQLCSGVRTPGMAPVSLNAGWSQRKAAAIPPGHRPARQQELGSIRGHPVRHGAAIGRRPWNRNSFTFRLMASGGTDRDGLMKRDQLLAAANQGGELQSIARQRPAADTAAAGGYR
ncbi:hypothetical protein RAG23_14900 [Klebsiella quasipneumoniae subsp. similipneumoniae]